MAANMTTDIDATNAAGAMANSIGQADMEEFITKIEENPCLWDKTKRHIYSDKEKRGAAIARIAEFFEVDEIVVQKKWNNLRDQFTKEDKIWRGKSGQAQIGAKKKWTHYDRLLFLRNTIAARQ